VFRQLLLLSGLVLLSGCSWPVRQMTDQTVTDFVDHPFDISPELTAEVRNSPQDSRKKEPTPSSSRAREKETKAAVPEVATDAKTATWMQSSKDPTPPKLHRKDDKLQPAVWTVGQLERTGAGTTPPPQPQFKLELNIPPELPGSEAPRVRIPIERAAGEREIERIYPELPPLPIEPKVVPGPDGKPYTLADLQRMAAANSPNLRQASSDVEAAKGNLIQAKTYPNPVTSYLVDPSNNNSTAGVQGGAIDQPIITGGKMRLGVAAAQKALDNAILALKRARNDLSTSVRNAYFTVLVDVETLVVTRAQARLADDIYRLQVGLQKGTQAAPYEPTALRAQAFTNRLAYKQAIASYVYDWKALVAAIGMQQLPLSQVAGRVDRLIPYYDYDEILGHVLQNHTDILTARNGVNIAQYNLKVTQVTPIFPNLDVRYSLEKDFALGPFGTYQTLALGFPLPVWDQNKGNIIAAQAALVRAGEEAHRVHVALTSGLALAYEGYRNNLYAMEYYRRYILPDLVRYYRGVFERRQIDPSSAFGDLVFAQQNLSTNVTAYIGILGSLWSSVVSVADYLQTDDLFQFAKPRELPELPDLSQLPAIWACGHGSVCATPSGVIEPSAAVPSDEAPAPRPPGEAPMPAAPAAGAEPVQPTQRGPASAGFSDLTVPVTSYFGKGESHEGQDR
jgi:outer membrane protein, heavy metal efflux system